jgi:hypothetical protein
LKRRWYHRKLSPYRKWPLWWTSRILHDNLNFHLIYPVFWQLATRRTQCS